MSEIEIGDIMEGIGTHKVRVRVDKVFDDIVICTLVRSGKGKAISMRTLQKAYRLIERQMPGKT